MPIYGTQTSANPLAPGVAALGSLLAPNLLDYLRRGSQYNPQVQPSGKLGDLNWAKRIGGVGQDVSNLLQLPFALAAPADALAGRVASAVPAAASGLTPAAEIAAVRGGANLGAPMVRGAPSISPALRGLLEAGTGATAAPGVGQAIPSAAAADVPSGRPEFTQEDQARLTQLQATIDQGQKSLQTLPGTRAYQHAPLSGRNAMIGGINTTIKAAQDEMDRLRSGMSDRQATYDQAGQPLSMRDPTMVDNIRKGALGLAAAHGIVRGLLGKNPVATAAMGTGEALAGAFAPTMIDLFKPKDTVAYKTAHDSLTNPDYYKSVIGPDMGYGLVLSSVGHGLGNTGADVGKALGRGVAGAYNFMRGAGPNAGTLAASIPEALPPAPIKMSDVKQVGKSYQLRAGHPSGQGGRFVKRSDIVDFPNSSP